MSARSLSILFLAAGLSLTACGDKDDDSGGSDGADGTADGADGTADGADGTADGTDGTADGTDGTADGTDGTADGTDGTADGTDGTADGADGTGVEDSAIYEMQTGVTVDGDTVTIEGVVASPIGANSAGSGYYVLDGNGGTYSGVWVFAEGLYDEDVGVTEGMVYEITGTHTEYLSFEGDDTVTELLYTDASVAVAASSSVIAIPPPEVVTTADLADSATAESYEGVLVTVRNSGALTVVEADLGFGEWSVDDGLVIDDFFVDYNDTNAILAGATFDSITGFVHYSFGAYKIEPRYESDFQNYTAPPCPGDLCISDLGLGDVILTEVANDVVAADSESHCEWLEVYNNTSGSVDLNGMLIGDDDSSSNWGTVASSTVVASGDYAVLARTSASDWATNCPVNNVEVTPDAFFGANSMTFSNSGDMFFIAQPGGDETNFIDSTVITLDGPAGTSIQLDSTLISVGMAGTANDVEGAWCDSTTSFGSNGQQGTPGSANVSCSVSR